MKQIESLSECVCELTETWLKWVKTDRLFHESKNISDRFEHAKNCEDLISYQKFLLREIDRIIDEKIAKREP